MNLMTEFVFLLRAKQGALNNVPGILGKGVGVDICSKPGMINIYAPIFSGSVSSFIMRVIYSNPKHTHTHIHPPLEPQLTHLLCYVSLFAFK